MPAGVLEMLKIQGLGPKKVKVLYEKLRITGVTELEAAAKAGRLEKLDGFGKKTEENILQGIQAMRNRGEKSLYPVAVRCPQKCCWLTSAKNEGCCGVQSRGASGGAKR